MVKGASGSKPCALCKNIVLDRSVWLPDATGYCQPLSSTDTSKHKMYTDSDINGIQDRLKVLATTGTPAELFDYEQTMGYAYSEFSLLQDKNLGIQPISSFGWDKIASIFTHITACFVSLKPGVRDGDGDCAVGTISIDCTLRQRFGVQSISAVIKSGILLATAWLLPHRY